MKTPVDQAVELVFDQRWVRVSASESLIGFLKEELAFDRFVFSAPTKGHVESELCVEQLCSEDKDGVLEVPAGLKERVLRLIEQQGLKPKVVDCTASPVVPVPSQHELRDRYEGEDFQLLGKMRQHKRGADPVPAHRGHRS